ncbi:MAG TPA: DUF1571 domain-containing protein [Firmicutes bacterium]|nr:DUF1571 domain-containing protein [Bacillota bacterium]
MKRFFHLLTFFFLVIAITFISGNEISGEEEGEPAFCSKEEIADYLFSMEEVFSEIDTYNTIMTKQIRLKNKVTEKETMEIYFKKPFSVKLISKNQDKDQVIVYIEGKNDGKMIVRLKTVIDSYVRLKVDPEGKLAMKNQLHSVKEASLGKTIDLIVKNLRRGLEENKLQLDYNGKENKYNTTLYSFTGFFNAAEEDGYFCKKAVIKVDSELKLPREIIIYDWEDNIREWYEYLEIRLNVTITDAVFDI